MFGRRNRATLSPTDRSKPAGLDVTASRAVAATVVAGQPRPVALAGDAAELPLVLALDRRPPAVGWAGHALLRRRPHLAAASFLPMLGQPREWPNGRGRVTPEAAVTAAFEAVRSPLAVETDAVVLALPAYLTAAQATAAVGLAAAARLPLAGAVSAPLALAARHADLLAGDTPLALTAADPDGGRADGVVPFRPPAGDGPGWAVVVDCDEFALSAAAVAVVPEGAVQLAHGFWPRASLKAWTDRLIDALSDRCVRLCRRDPRDSADAEQAVFEQLPGLLDHLHAGRPTTISVRADRWYQDLHPTPDEAAGWCDALARQAADAVTELARGTDRPFPPRAVWLTHAAARLPGLAAALHAGLPERTPVLGLHPWAVSAAAASLAPHWQAGELPRAYLDVVIPESRRAAGVSRPVQPQSG
jgi:hypothetical protein